MRPKRMQLVGLVALAIATLALVAFAFVKPSIDRGTTPHDTPDTSLGLHATQAPPPPAVAFIGDSYTAGAGAQIGKGWVDVLAAAKGWKPVNLGRGGTGYLGSVSLPTARVACNLDFCPNYDDMIKDAVNANPDMVIVAGGRNDGATLTPALRDAVDKFYRDLRAALPKARIVALSPIWGADPQPDHAAFKAEVKAAAIASGADYVDIGEPLAAHPEMMIADGIHPNTAGHALLAQVVAAAIR